VIARDRTPWAAIASVLAALGACAVYAWLIPSASGMGDASELTLVLATGGVPHPTGYPLYVLTGHPFCVALHALGIGWSRAAALWSAVGSALALAFLLALGLWLAGAVTNAGAATRLLAAFVPLSLFAFQPIAVGEATRAEVNSWSLAWACGAALVFVRLVGRVRGGAAPARREAALWGLVSGLGLAHHLTSVLISMPLSAALVAMLVRRRAFSWALVLSAIGAALIPTASYGIIAWHAWHPARVQWALLDPSWGSVLAHITGRQYRFFVGYFAPSAPQRALLATVAFPFLFPGLLLLMLGMWRARDVEERLAWSALFAAASLIAVFTLRYGVDDPAPYLLPAMALGAAAAAPALAALPGVSSRAGTVTLAAVGLAGLLLIVPWIRDGLEEREATMDYEHTIRSMWGAIPPDTAIVSWADDRYHRLREYQILRGEKPALLVVTPDLFFANSMRRTIRERFGADPLEGFVPPHVAPGAADERGIIARHRAALVESLNVHVRVPVILFDPAKPIVFQLRKPWEAEVAPAR
jgi:transmembrane protein TMEM260 (protein O-mannosyltransferase)